MNNINVINNYHSINLYQDRDIQDHQRSQDYTEVVRRVSNEERKTIEGKLTHLAENKEVKISLLHEALNSQNWHHEIFHDENYPYYALEALGYPEGDERKLSRGQFATLMSYWKTAQNHPEIESLSLFNTNGSIDERAKAIIKQTLHLVCQEPIYFLTDDQIDQLFKEMAKLPKSEQQFFFIPYSEPKTVTARRVIYDLGVNIFSVFVEKSCFKQMIPSFGLMQTFLKVKYGSDAVEMLPVIGLSSLEDIRQNGLQGQRDFAVHFPDVNLPEKADDALAIGFDFSYHDFYHAFVASATPQKFRSLFIKIADVVNTFNNLENKSLSNKIHELYELFIDMETAPFRYEFRYTDSLNDIFWDYISSAFEFIPFISPQELFLKVKIAEKLGEEISLDEELLTGPEQVLAIKTQELDDKIRLFFQENPSVSPKDDLNQFPELIDYLHSKKTHPLKVIEGIWKQRLQGMIVGG